MTHSRVAKSRRDRPFQLDSKAHQRLTGTLTVYQRIQPYKTRTGRYGRASEGGRGEARCLSTSTWRAPPNADKKAKLARSNEDKLSCLTLADSWLKTAELQKLLKQQSQFLEATA